VTETVSKREREVPETAMPSPVPVAPAPQPRAARQTLRFVTAASLFDGHDASINVIRRVLQASGVEVIHLGHNRSVDEIVTAALQEDAHAIAVSSYQGGHIEFFTYMIDLLAQRGVPDVKVFGGGGGVIVPEEIKHLEAYGVARIYSPEDGQHMGLQGIIDDMIERADADFACREPADIERLRAGDERELARLITALEGGRLGNDQVQSLRRLGGAHTGVPTLGITGTGGAGKSSFTDELLRRCRLDRPDLCVAVLAIDPSKRASGGSLLGDRIRMNALAPGATFMRSLATRSSGHEVAACVPDAVAACKVAGYQLILVETAGIGQGDSAVEPLADASIYVMTPEYGAASQLEKIDMIDFADLIAINKFDRRGALDALRDVRKQVQRSRRAFDEPLEDMPVYGTVASHFSDDGMTASYHGLLGVLAAKGFAMWPSRLAGASSKSSSHRTGIVPAERDRYLAEVVASVRAYHAETAEQAKTARERQQLRAARRMLEDAGTVTDVAALDGLIGARDAALDANSRALLGAWPEVRAAYGGRGQVTKAGADKIGPATATLSLSGTSIPKVALPRHEDEGELLRWLRAENVPGAFPFTAGVFAFKRASEDPTRMFAGEGDPFRTNQRFKHVSRDMPAKRLSTAFDSVTLYGADPDERPDIYGKVGNAGVSVATLDDMKVLYDGFDLCDPATSVSMTINGPAPTILAMFLNTAIDQRVARSVAEHGREPDAAERARLRAYALENVRGTVQADILKEDQGQNTCLFSTEFGLKTMGDIQAYFIDNRVLNFYSVSISGYHIAEAGANPVSQLAFTLADGFTYVEAYLARGMAIDDFAPSLSFFFSAGLDPEYTVLGRVARRIWAIAMRDKYGASERSQKLKYHMQTSGRSLHAQEFDFNDIRTTLQALIASYDNCNSLHTNAYDEAITTPTEASVRRAIAIQLIINKEWGLAKNENPNQGSFIIDELTDLVEEAVLKEFERLSERGGVLGAMEAGYQRGKIQDESLHYETLKHDGRLPVVGVNTFRNPAPAASTTVVLQRSTEDEKKSQIARLHDFQRRHVGDAPAMIKRLKGAAGRGDNVFAVLMDAVRCCSLGQITDALFEVGGQYRRNM
jgi:methylmalonyl-CoA mutase